MVENMRKVMSLFVVIAVISAITAASFAVFGEQQKDANVAETSVSTTEKANQTLNDDNSINMPENSSSMKMVMKCITYAMYKDGVQYSMNNSKSFWTPMSYLLANYGVCSVSAKEDVEKDAVIMTAQGVREYASAMFSGFGRWQNIPSIPDELSSDVKHNTANSTYTVYSGNIRSVDVLINSCIRQDDGSYEISLSLYNRSEPENVLEKYNVEMVKNTQGSSSVFSYRITDVQVA